VADPPSPATSAVRGNAFSSADATGDGDAVPQPIIRIRDLHKTYDSGFQALKQVNLDIRRGEILALLGPNGAGKTTLISIICGIVRPSGGEIHVAGHDIAREYRAARSMIGLVPQELATDTFETVRATVSFSRGLFGCPPDPARIEHVLRLLSLWDKRDDRILTLSGGMKRRVLIAKALAHDPQILFLDEPTAGVDVELRKDMWAAVRDLRDQGVTIILTTHYIEEAEDLADRIGIINHGELMLVKEKQALLRSLGRKQLIVDLQAPLDSLPPALGAAGLVLTEDGCQLIYDYDSTARQTGITKVLADMRDAGIAFADLRTSQSSLEDIFVTLVQQGKRT
jgi:ABC-2 type transport system ATP-binding protein